MIPKPTKPEIKLLIVDDNQEFIDRVRARLEAIDPRVRFVCQNSNSGDEVLIKVKEFLPDVILLDNMLASEQSSFKLVSAADVYEQLKANGFSGISVIVISYDLDVHDAKSLIKQGVKYVFNKDDLFYDPDGYKKLADMIKSCA